MAGIKGKSGVYVRTERHKKSLAAAHKGIIFTKEHKQKIKESCRNCPVVHHINGNHFDDRPENRMILTPREHAQIHQMQGDLHHFEKGNKCACKKDKVEVK